MYREHEHEWDIYQEDYMCSNCGRTNHFTHLCRATRDIRGNKITPVIKKIRKYKKAKPIKK